MRSDDLLVLLEVARSGTLVSAATSLGLNHSTVSRRLDAMEKEYGGPLVSRTSQDCHLTELGRALLESAEAVERALAVARMAAHGPSAGENLSGLVRISAPEALSVHFVTPALAKLHAKHPDVVVELTVATRPIAHGSGADVEVGVGQPLSRQLKPIRLADYELGLFASTAYLERHGTPMSIPELADHALVYYVDRLLRVDDLDLIDHLFAGRSVQFGSTSVFSQIEATRAGVGIGLVPKFLATQALELIPVLPNDVRVNLTYIAVLAQSQLRRAPAIAALQAIQTEVTERRRELKPSAI